MWPNVLITSARPRPGSGTKGSALSAAKFTVRPTGKSGTDVIEGTVTGINLSAKLYASPLFSSLLANPQVPSNCERYARIIVLLAVKYLVSHEIFLIPRKKNFYKMEFIEEIETYKNIENASKKI